MQALILTLLFSTIPLLERPISISEGETRSIAVPGHRFVHKLFIQANGIGPDAYVEVSAAGDVKGTLYLPGHDPHYVVTVERAVPSIELTVVKGRASIASIQAVVSDSGGPEPFPSQAHSRMGKLALEAIWVQERLAGFASVNEAQTYLTPIRNTGARAYAIAEASGDASGSARPYYEQFLAALDHATPFLTKKFEVHEAFTLAVRMMTVTERVRSVLK